MRNVLPVHLQKYLNIKILALVIGVLFVLSLIAIAALNYQFKVNATNYAAEAFELPVEIEKARRSWFRKTARLQNVKISNTPGFQTPWVMTIEEIRVKTASLSDRPVMIGDLEIKGVRFYAERGDTGTLNITQMYQTLSERAESEEPEFAMTVTPVNIHIKDTALIPAGDYYSRFDDPIALSDKSPLSGSDTAVTLSVNDLTGVALQSYGYDIFEGMMKLHLQIGLARGRDLGDQFIEDLQMIGDAIENAITESFSLQP